MFFVVAFVGESYISNDLWDIYRKMIVGNVT